MPVCGADRILQKGCGSGTAVCPRSASVPVRAATARCVSTVQGVWGIDGSVLPLSRDHRVAASAPRGPMSGGWCPPGVLVPCRGRGRGRGVGGVGGVVVVGVGWWLGGGVEGLEFGVEGLEFGVDGGASGFGEVDGGEDGGDDEAGEDVA